MFANIYYLVLLGRMYHILLYLDLKVSIDKESILNSSCRQDLPLRVADYST